MSPHRRVGVSLGGGATRGREAWLGCQVPSPFVRLLSCCLGQSPEQPPPERADLCSQPAPAPNPPRPLPSPARLQTQVRTIGGQVSLGRGKGSERPRGREADPRRLWAGKGRSQGAPPCTGDRGRAGVLGAATERVRGSGGARLGARGKGGEGSGQVLWLAPPPGPAELSRRRVPNSGPASCGGDFHLLGLLPSAHSVVRNLLFGKLAAAGLFGATLTPPHASSSLSLPLYSPRPGWGPIVCARFAQLWGLSAHFPSDAGPTCQAGEHRESRGPALQLCEPSRDCTCGASLGPAPCVPGS